MSQIDIQTEKDAEEVRDAVRYAAAVIANIRARLDKFGECYVDKSDLLRIWGGKSWLDAQGNLNDRVSNLAKYMNAKVSWPSKSEAHFTRQVPIIQIIPSMSHYAN